MPSISDSQFPPPKNWEEFENICYELWTEIWQDLNTQKNGRKGQPQSGVDVYGKPSNMDAYAGIQCKGKNNFLKSKLSVQEIDKEVTKALTFKPPLKQFLIATTEYRDSNIQEYVRIKNEEQKKEGLFEIRIVFWEDIQTSLETYIEIAKKYWPQFFHNQDTTGVSSQEPININIQTEAELNIYSAQQSTINVQNIYPLGDAVKTILTDKYNSDVDYVRDLIINHKPGEAISSLNNLKNKIWVDAPSQLKFRILTNLASSHLAINEIDLSAKLYIEALQYNPDDEKALTNVALGYLILKDYTKSKLYSESALEKNPTSGRAFAIFLQCIAPDYTIEEMESKISNVFKDDPEVLHALGFICRNKLDFVKAEFYIEKAYTYKKEDQIEIVNSYATILLENVLQNNPIVFRQPLLEAESLKLRRSLELLNKVWDTYQDFSLRKSKIGMLVNRSIIKRILKDYWGAISDIDEVLKVEGENPEYIKFKALLLVDVQDINNAITLLDKIHLNTKVPESDLILSELLEEKNEFSRAIRILEESRQKIEEGELKQDVTSSLVDLYLKNKNLEEALKLSETLITGNPFSVNSFITYANVLKANGNHEQSDEKLLEALKHCEKLKDKFLLAEELFAHELFTQAAELYESFVIVGENNHLVRRMVGSFYYSGQLGKALQICIKLREKFQPMKFITEIEIDIYERIGDLNKAIMISTEYLRIFKNDLKIKIRRAFVCLRQRDFSSVDEFLEGVLLNEYLELPPQYLQKISLLFSERGRSLESINVLYETRRKFFNTSDAHMLYVGAFFMRESEFEKDLENNIIKIDSAVHLQDRLGLKKWYIIENRDDINFDKNEISYTHPLARQMIGKNVGDMLTLEQDSTQYKIIEMKSKYVYALHESIALYPQLFPNRKDFQMISLEPKDEPGDDKLDFKPLFDQIDQLGKYVKKAEELYLNGPLTIGGLSNYMNRNIFEVLTGIMSKNHIGVRCCLGTVNERLNVSENIKSYNKLVIDIISLLLVYEFKLEAKISELFNEVYVAQSILDLLNETISLKRGLAKRGYVSIAKEKNHYVKSEIDATMVQQSIEFYENLIIWINSNFIVQPCSEALNIPSEEKSKLDKIFQSHFIDSVLLAKEKNGLLYSDDYKLRYFAKHNYQVNGFWSQILLIDLLNKGKIADDEYENYTIKLVISNFYHTSISSKTIISSLQKSNWLPDSPFLDVVQILNGKSSDLNTSIIVASNLFMELKDQPITPERRQNIIFIILDKLSSHRNPRIVIDSLIKQLNYTFLLLPLYLNELFRDIDAWTKVNFS